MSAQASKAVNVSLTLRNWLIGLYITEYEQQGKNRAESVPAKTFVGEVIFSDFACFELQGIVQGQTEPGWNAEFLADLRGFLELLSPTESI